MENEPEKPSSSLPPIITKAEIEEKSKQRIIFYYIRTALLVLFSSLLVAFASYSLIEPNRFTIGGVAGTAVIISYATNGAIRQSWLVFGINMPLIILSFFFVKRKFAILTTSNILLQSLWLTIFENTNMPVIQFTDTGTSIFAAIGAGVCVGTSIALALKAGGSTGGVDILAVMIQKKYSASSIAQMIFFLSAIVISASFFVFYEPEETLAMNLLPIFLSLFEAYIESKTNDSITNGFQSAIEFRVITNKPDEMSLALMNELSRGVTAMPATGMYTKENRTMLVCVISRRQINAFKRIMKQIDPDAFAILANVSQVVGLGFYQSEN